MRPILAGSLALSSVVLLATLSSPSWLKDSQGWLRGLVTNEAANFKPAEAETQIADVVQSVRHHAGLKALVPDLELHNWLAQRLGHSDGVDLTSLANEIQESCPRYLKLSSTAVQSSSVEGLIDQVSKWSEQNDEDFTHLTVVARARRAGMGFEGVVFAGQRLGDLVPELITQGREQFFSVCPLCGHAQSGQVLARHRTVSLECPNCHRVYAILAEDTHGTFHYVSRYLTGYAPPAHFPRKITRTHEMLRIWDEVIHVVDYKADYMAGVDDADIWQTAPETQQLGTGDCEDSSIFLADWLISRGFEVRLAMGRLAENGGHVWALVRLGGKSYLLEATNPNADVSTPPLASEVGARYVPEALFDREAIYIRKNPSAPWSGDYWSSDEWQRVETPGSKVFPNVAAKVTEGGSPAHPVAGPSQH